jgi:hypothetical protein
MQSAVAALLIVSSFVELFWTMFWNGVIGYLLRSWQVAWLMRVPWLLMVGEVALAVSRSCP